MAYDLTQIRAEHRPAFREAESNVLLQDALDEIFSIYVELKKRPRAQWGSPVVLSAVDDAVEAARVAKERKAERKRTKAVLHPSAAELKQRARAEARRQARLAERAIVISEG